MTPIRSLALAAALAAATAPALAQQFTVGDLTVEKPWSRATPKGAPVAAGYLVVHNRGKVADTLLDGTADFAAAVQVHEMSMANGIMKMRQLTSGLEIPANGTVTLAPSGYHLMFTGLKRQLNPGETVKATLVFAHSGPLTVDFQVTGIGAAGPGSAKPPAADPMKGMKMD